MMIKITISKTPLVALRSFVTRMGESRAVVLAGALLAVAATFVSYSANAIIAYGDAESHLNISKRIVDSITPGLAQLGGIWLPLPHILMTPLVAFDIFWRTGLAGSIVSGIAYIATAYYLYQLTLLITKKPVAALAAAAVFLTNLNVLYLQSTPMTELPLIIFFVGSTYYFVRYLYNQGDLNMLLMAALFGFCATLTRYDGWFLVLIEAGLLGVYHLARNFRTSQEAAGVWRAGLDGLRGNFGNLRVTFVAALRKERTRIEGAIVLFSTLAFFGILLWLMWDFLILGDPLYFTHSQFSAKSQQQGWLAKGQLPAYHDLILSFIYYAVTTMSNTGVIPFFVACVAFTLFLADRSIAYRYTIAALLAVPFVFYVVTLFIGQSIIFIPHITPASFEWTLFNVRYGVMMIPATAFLIGYLFSRVRPSAGLLLGVLLVGQFFLYGAGYANIITYEDGVRGLSTAKRPDAEFWMSKEYDGGIVVLDDYSRLMSIIRSGIPMENVIYIGNKPYWEESLREPEKYATWLIIQRNDEVWKTIYEPPEMQGRLYKYFTKVYTSPEILIFKRTDALGSTGPS